MKSRLKQRTNLITAAVLTAIDYIIAFLAWEMLYLSNDDGSIQGALSGAWTGTPEYFHQFIQIFISFPIAGLYKIFPGVQWWYVCSQILVCIGVFLVHFCLIKIACKNKFAIPFVIAVLLFFDLGFFVIPISQISFTIVPAILGTGIVAGLFWMAETDAVKHKKWAFAGIIVGYIILLSWRKDTGFVLLCYILLMFLYYFISRDQNRKKAALRFLCIAVIFVVLTAAFTVTNNVAQSRHNGEEFVAFNNARMQFSDYPHITYEEDPEFFEEIGWDRDTYNIADNYGLLNDHINTETLSYITESSEHTKEDVVATLEFLYYDYFDSAILLMYAASFVMGCVALIISRNKKTLIFWLLNNVGTILLFCYQLFMGRVIYRSLMVMLLPAVVINLMLSFRQEMVKRRARRILMITVLILGVICVWPMGRATFDREYNVVEKDKKEKYMITCEYISEHMDNFYVSQGGVGDFIAPFRASIKTTNLIKWGTSTYYSALYYDQLHANGLSELTGETFKNDNVYFISATNALSMNYVDEGNNTFASFYRSLKKDHNALGFVQVDTIASGGYVYHFVFEENEDQYDSYYDIVDGRTVRIQP